MFPKRNVKYIYISVCRYSEIIPKFGHRGKSNSEDSCECSRAYVDIPYLSLRVRPNTRNVDEDLSTFFMGCLKPEQRFLDVIGIAI